MLKRERLSALSNPVRETRERSVLATRTPSKKEAKEVKFVSARCFDFTPSIILNKDNRHLAGSKGWIINMKNVIKMTLLDAPQEVWLRVIEFKDKKLQDKLAGHGMFIGDRLRVLREAPLKGPFMIDLNGRQIALGREVVKKILVEKE